MGQLSAPGLASFAKILVRELVEYLSERVEVTVEEIRTVTEETHLRLPIMATARTAHRL
jgi:hypothetical protein